LEQQSGKFLCKTVSVQFDDELVPALGTFSGLYTRTLAQRKGLFVGHVTYTETKGTGIFAYCNDAWVFAYRNKNDDDDDDDDKSDPCQHWSAKSDDTISFDLLTTSTSEWFARDKNGRIMPMQNFRLSCFDCQEDEDFCGDNGSCSVDDNTCQCEEGYYGLRCEFLSPCPKITTDERVGGLVSSRDWSSTYEMMRDADDAMVEVYNRPVWISEYEPGLFDLIFFTGRRWVITYSNFLGLPTSESSIKDGLALFLHEFHGHYSDYQVAFVSEPMDRDTPKEAATPSGLKFFSAAALDPSNPSIQSADESQPSSAVFLCSICNNSTNPCFYDGVCMEETCQCSVGSKGALCEVPPTGNAICDKFFNGPSFNWDGGDCCESTCLSTTENTCGKATDNPYVDVGYFFCHEEYNTWKQKSQPIESISGRNAESGTSVSLLGNMLAVAEPRGLLVRVFDKDGSEWIHRGRVLEGPARSGFGEKIAMSSSLRNTKNNIVSPPPATLLVGASRAGTVSVYDCSVQLCELQQDLLGRRN
jgi:hypothetical protein